MKPAVTTSYTLTCTGAGGSIAKSVTETVTPVAPPPPPVGTLPHQPAGLNALVDEPWNVPDAFWLGRALLGRLRLTRECGGGCDRTAQSQQRAAVHLPGSDRRRGWRGSVGQDLGVE